MLGCGLTYHLHHSKEGITTFDDNSPSPVYYVIATWRVLGLTIRRQHICEVASREEALNFAIDDMMAKRRRWTRQHPSINVYVAV